jgi:membrane protease YdiL (CAAX protease family)
MAIHNDQRADDQRSIGDRLPRPDDAPLALRWVRRHQVITFFALTYVISWSLWAFAAAGAGHVVFLLGGWGPVASAIVVTLLSGKSVVAWLGSLLVWRFAPGYYAMALLLPVAIYAVINVVLLVLGQQLDLSLLRNVVPSYLGTFLMVATVGGGLEEPGWRGFALPKLQQRRSPVVATLLVGLAWGIWHVPLCGPAGFVVPMVLAFCYTWLYNRTGSMLICLLLHASFTPAQNLLTLARPGAAQADGPVDSTDLVILGVYLVAAVGLCLVTRGRLGATTAHPQPADPSLRSGS